MKKLILLLLIVLLPTISMAVFPDGWHRKAELQIQNSYIDSTLTNFPVLFTPANLPTEMFDSDLANRVLSANGGEIRFTSDEAGTTLIPHELVPGSFTQASGGPGTGEIWVNVPSISSSATTSIWIWYNKTGETSPNGELAWNSNFKAVYHFQGTSGTTGLLDATSNNNDLSITGAPTFESTGKIGDGVAISEGNFMERVDAASLGGFSGFLLSAWVYRTGTNSEDYGRIISKAQGTSSDDYHFGIIATTNNLTARINVTTSGTVNTNSSQNWTVNTFMYGYARWDGSTHYTSLNDVAETSTSTAEGTLDDTNEDLGIGQHATETADTRYVIGILDEVRIIGADVGKAWANAEYDCSNSPELFVLDQTPIPATQFTIITSESGRIEDASMEDYTNRNNGSGTSILAYDNASVPYFSLIRVDDLYGAIGYSKNITAMGCSLYVWQDYTSDGEDTVFFYRCLKPWVEGTGTKQASDSNSVTPDMWDKVINTSGLAWGTARAKNRSDAGVENSGDGTDFDALATAFDTILIDGTDGIWIEVNIDTAIANEAYNSDGEFSILMEKSTQETNSELIYIYSSESVTNKPRFWIEYEDKPGTIVLEDDTKFDMNTIGSNSFLGIGANTVYNTVDRIYWGYPQGNGSTNLRSYGIFDYDTTIATINIDSVIVFMVQISPYFVGEASDTLRPQTGWLVRDFVETEITWDSAQTDPGGVDWTTDGAQGSGDTAGYLWVGPKTAFGTDPTAGDIIAWKLSGSATSFPPWGSNYGAVVFSNRTSGGSGPYWQIYSDHASVSGNRPYMIVYYTEAASGTTKYLKLLR